MMCRGGAPDRDANCVLPSTQMDQDGPFASMGCVGPLEMPLHERVPLEGMKEF
jgi:hypothetical protein